MKIHNFFFLVFLFSPLLLWSQEGFKSTMNAAEKAYQRREFMTANSLYEKACRIATDENELKAARAGIQKCKPSISIVGIRKEKGSVGCPEDSVAWNAGRKTYRVSFKNGSGWEISPIGKDSTWIKIVEQNPAGGTFTIEWQRNDKTASRRSLNINIKLKGGAQSESTHFHLYQEGCKELRVNGESSLEFGFLWEGGVKFFDVAGVPDGQDYQIKGIDTSWMSVQKHKDCFFLTVKNNETNTERNKVVLVTASSKKCTINLSQNTKSFKTTESREKLDIRCNLLSYDCYTDDMRTFGFIDATGEVIIAPIFDGYKTFENGLCAVAKKINGVLRVGMIDEKANVVVPFVYKWIDEYCISNRITVVDTNNQIGFLDGTGKLRINCQYEPDDFLIYYPHFVEGINGESSLSVVRKNGMYGAIDTNGKTVVPFVYDYMSDFHSLALVEKNDKYGFVNTKGDGIIPIEYDDAAAFGPSRGDVNPHFNPFYDYHYDPYTYVRKGDTIRYIFMPKKRLIEKDYTQWILPLNAGQGKNFALAYLPEFVSNVAPFKNPETNKYGLLYYETGNWFYGLEREYDWMGKVSIPRQLVRDGSKYYYRGISLRADTVYYEFARDYEMVNMGRGKKYVARVRKDGKLGLINEKGKTIMDFVLDEIFPFDSYNGFTLFRKNGQSGYLDVNGHIVWCPNVKIVSNHRTGLSILKVGDKYGFYEVSGLVIIKPHFDDAKDFSEGYAAVKVGTKWGYINQKGEMVIPAVFDESTSFLNGYATVSIDGKKYRIDKKGTIAID